MGFTVILVGAGNMGGAMLRGWIGDGMAPANICVVDPVPTGPMVEWLGSEGIKHCVDASDASKADVLLIAVKPQVMDKVLTDIKPLVGPDTVAVSVAAGKTLAAIAEPLGNPATIRAMPNTPSLVGRGITVACPNAHVTPEQRAMVADLLEATGKLEWVEDEVLIDAVTAVSGSGPAYVFYLTECLADAGIKAGLPEPLARKLALETVAGAGELMRQSKDPPAQLRKNVTSPNGTTAAALEILMDEDGLQSLMDKAVAAARKRSEELS